MADAEVSTWYILACGLSLSEPSFDLGSSLTLRRLEAPISIFDLAAAGAAGLREWAVLEPIVEAATVELVSDVSSAHIPGFDALNKGWLVSALLVLRGFAYHLFPACSAYSWNLISGHSGSMGKPGRTGQLPPFKGGLLDFHLRILEPKRVRRELSANEAGWIAQHFDQFNRLAANERFHLALTAAVDWRFSKDKRSAIARLWTGIESLLAMSSELVFRISVYGAIATAPKGSMREAAFKKIKSLYGIRSKAVHGGPLSDVELDQALDESFEFLRLLLIDAVERGGIRTEQDFMREILG